MENVFLSIGHGYAAARVARALPDGWRVIGTTRSTDRAAALAAQGIEPVIWQAGGPVAALAEAFAQATHVVSSVAPTEGGTDPVLPALADLPAPRLRWMGYLSATSVMGSGDDWQDENTPPAPGTARGKARLAAEAAWKAFGQGRGAGVAALRIAGIYGPGHSAIDQLQAGTARRVVKPGQVFNRIHVTDLGRIVAAAAVQGATGPFLLSDGDPAPPQDVVAHAAELTGLPCPPEVPFDEAQMSPMARSFYSENKRLRSVRIGPELGVSLHYPDYRAGLAAIAAGET